MRQYFNFLKRIYQIEKVGFFCLALFLGSLHFTGCLENAGVTTATNPIVNSPGGFGNLPSGDSTANSIITLQDVLRSNADPTASLDLISQNGQIGNNCPTLNDCKCVFRWTDSSGIIHRVEQASSYVESDLLRCLYTIVDAGVQHFDVTLMINAASIESNPFTVYQTASNPGLDPSIANNYLQAQRYMCRDILTQANNTNFYINKSFLDPRLWDMGQFYNLYTTSFGADYGAVAIQQGQTLVQPKGFECPPNPNDSSFDDNLDPTLYSVLPLDLTNPSNLNVVNVPGVGDNTIFPSNDDKNNAANCPTGNEAACEKFKANRHDFYLATFQAGVFSQPFCTTHQAANFVSATGGLNCTVDATKGQPVLGSLALASGGQDIIGFAAIPDSSENCPSLTAVQIPANRKWAKVWRFRLSIQARTIQDVTNPGDIGELFCTNRAKECGTSLNVNTGSGSQTNSVCFDEPSPKSSTSVTTGLLPQPSTPGNGNCNTTGTAGDQTKDFSGSGQTGWASGTSAAGKCSGGNGTGTIMCCLDNGTAGTTNNPANYTAGGDYCNPTLHGAHNAEAANPPGNDNWLIGNGNKKACIEDDTDANGKITLGTFPDPRGTYQLGSRALEDNSRDDVVYVVTPPNITIATMQDPTSVVAKQYTPSRRIVKGGTLFPYSLDTGSSNTDQAQQRASIFPLCVLQDSQGGS